MVSRNYALLIDDAKEGTSSLVFEEVFFLEILKYFVAISSLENVNRCVLTFFLGSKQESAFHFLVSAIHVHEQVNEITSDLR
jgi:hypothetical protein